MVSQFSHTFIVLSSAEVDRQEVCSGFPANEKSPFVVKSCRPACEAGPPVHFSFA